MKRLLYISLLYVLFSLPTMAQTYQEEVVDSCAVEALDVDAMTPEECRFAIKLAVAGERLLLPGDISEGLRQVDYKVENDVLPFVYNFDERIIPYDALLLAKDMLREEYKRLIGSEEIRFVMKACVKAGYGVGFLSHGTLPGNKLRLDFTVSEIKAITNSAEAEF